MLHRGIYDAAVFRGQIKISGKFAAPDIAALKIDPADVLWKDAAVTLAVSDLRGTREGLVLDWDGTKTSAPARLAIPGYTTGITAPLGGDQPIAAPARFPSRSISTAAAEFSSRPFGMQNRSSLKSNWPDPGFRGAFLPAERVGASGWFRGEMEGLVLRPRLSAALDEPLRQRTFYDQTR